MDTLLEITYRHITDVSEINLPSLIKLLTPLTTYYPNNIVWLKSTLQKGVCNNERSVIVAEVNDKLIGCVIMKKSHWSLKVCTLYVDAAYRKQGIGSALLHRAMVYLGDVNIKLTLCEEINTLHSELFKNKGFRLNHVVLGKYRPGGKEYHYSSTHIPQ